MNNKNSRVKIPVPDSVFLRWKELYQHGDFSAIAERFGGTASFQKHHVQRTFRERSGWKEVIDAMQKFYDVRERYLSIQQSKILKKVTESV